MTFWLLLSGCLALAFVLIGLGLEAWAERRPTEVDARDWQRISEEKDDDFARRRTLGHATHSRTAPTTRVPR